MRRTLRTGEPAGFGELDRRMAEKLQVASPADANAIARANGLEDPQDAR